MTVIGVTIWVGARIGDIDRKIGLINTDPDVCGRGSSGMLENVGQAFLDDAVPLWAYAFNEVSRHLNAATGDPHADLAHYAGTAAAAIAIPLAGLVASFRTPGSKLSLWCAGLGAISLGTAGIVFPDQSSSIGSIWGVTAIVWGVTFAAVGARAWSHLISPGPRESFSKLSR